MLDCESSRRAIPPRKTSLQPFSVEAAEEEPWRGSGGCSFLCQSAAFMDHIFGVHIGIQDNGRWNRALPRSCHLKLCRDAGPLCFHVPCGRILARGSHCVADLTKSSLTADTAMNKLFSFSRGQFDISCLFRVRGACPTVGFQSSRAIPSLDPTHSEL